MSTTTEDTMQTLAQEHSKDACYHGDRPDWLIAYAQHRDSDTLTRSNWTSFVEALGGESDTVAIERSSHFLVGWVEYLVIDPSDTERVKLAEEIRAGLEDYPVIDEQAWSNLEWEEYQEAWQNWGERDFIRSLQVEFNLSDPAEELLSDADSDKLVEFYESLIPSGEYYISESSGVALNVEYAVKRCSRQQMAAFLRSIR